MSTTLWSLLGMSTQPSDAVNQLMASSPSSINDTNTQLQSDIDKGEHKGDLITAKGTKIFRICHININGITQTKNNPKNMCLNNFRR